MSDLRSESPSGHVKCKHLHYFFPNCRYLILPKMGKPGVLIIKMGFTDDHKNLSMGLGLQQYTALVLFADEDIDFVQEMVEKLEGEYGLKVSLDFHL